MKNIGNEELSDRENEQTENIKLEEVEEVIRKIKLGKAEGKNKI